MPNRRHRLAAAAACIAVAALLAGCASAADLAGSGASDSPATTEPTSPPTEDEPTEDEPTSGTLEELVVPRPDGYAPGEDSGPTATGPYTKQEFLETFSTTPEQDERILDEAGFEAGYHLFGRTPDGQRWVHVYLDRLESHEGAALLADEFWKQQDHPSPFSVEGIEGARGGTSTTEGSGSGEPAKVTIVSYVVDDTYVGVICGTRSGSGCKDQATQLAKRQYETLSQSSG